MTPPLERSIRVRCSVERAFEVFTAEVDAWWPSGHRRFERSCLLFEAEEGGRLVERAETGEEVVLGDVLVCDPPHRLVYTWFPGAFARPTEVEVRFTPAGAHTLVEVTHAAGASALGDAWPERLEIFGRAWSEVLPAFAARAAER